MQIIDWSGRSDRKMKSNDWIEQIDRTNNKLMLTMVSNGGNEQADDDEIRNRNKETTQIIINSSNDIENKIELNSINNSNVGIKRRRR